MTALTSLYHREVHLPFLFHSGRIPEKALLNPRDRSMARSLVLNIAKYSPPSSGNCPVVLEEI